MSKLTPLDWLLAKNPNDADACMVRARWHVARKEIPAAQAEVDRVLAMEGMAQDPRRLIQAGEVFMAAERTGQAREYFRRLRTALPDSPVVDYSFDKTI